MFLPFISTWLVVEPEQTSRYGSGSPMTVSELRAAVGLVAGAVLECARRRWSGRQSG